MLAKYYPTVLGYGVWFPEEVCKWIKKHMECSPNFGNYDLGGDKCFDVYAESNDAYDQLIEITYLRERAER